VADKPGTFTAYCTVPCGAGHPDMKAKLVVE
ncbi:cytochrome C oxidase subunit II, partial [Candidatus Woesearchaeota archaeon]|nr:cytochrome C oxidase subunit II [Candidatus Woesearchaeota archaeon]